MVDLYANILCATTACDKCKSLKMHLCGYVECLLVNYYDSYDIGSFLFYTRASCGNACWSLTIEVFLSDTMCYRILGLENF